MLHYAFLIMTLIMINERKGISYLLRMQNPNLSGLYHQHSTHQIKLHKSHADTHIRSLHNTHIMLHIKDTCIVLLFTMQV